jgi:hypothetical protein
MVSSNSSMSLRLFLVKGGLLATILVFLNYFMILPALLYTFYFDDMECVPLFAQHFTLHPSMLHWALLGAPWY